MIKSGFLACQHKSSNLLRSWRRSLHWEGLSRSRLTICKHANIVALARRPWRQCQRFNILPTGWRVLLCQWMYSTFKKIVMFIIKKHMCPRIHSVYSLHFILFSIIFRYHASLRPTSSGTTNEGRSVTSKPRKTLHTEIIAADKTLQNNDLNT